MVWEPPLKPLMANKSLLELTITSPQPPSHRLWLFTLFSSLILFDHVAFTLGRKENVTSLKYLFSKSGHTLRMFTTSSATSSSSAAVFKPNRKCRSVRFPPLSETERRAVSREPSYHTESSEQQNRPQQTRL